MLRLLFCSGLPNHILTRLKPGTGTDSEITFMSTSSAAISHSRNAFPPVLSLFLDSSFIHSSSCTLSWPCLYSVCFFWLFFLIECEVFDVQYRKHLQYLQRLRLYEMWLFPVRSYEVSCLSDSVQNTRSTIGGNYLCMQQHHFFFKPSYIQNHKTTFFLPTTTLIFCEIDSLRCWKHW